MKIHHSFLLFLITNTALAAECPRLENSVRLTATGDILVHRALYEQAVESSQKFQLLWKPLISKLSEADITIGNLEGPVAPGVNANGQQERDPGFVYDNNIYSGTNFVFNYHPYLLEDLKQSGFDILTTANNHSLDRRSLGINSTIEEASRIGIPTVGTRKQGSTDPFSITYKSHGYLFGFISCTEMTNGIPDRYAQVLNCTSETVLNEITRLRDQVDAVLVFPHWGDEYELEPSPRQQKMATSWTKAGAIAVIGNHPHVLQTTTWMAGLNQTKSLVIYSLGNFVAGQAAMQRRATALAHLDFIMGAGGKLEIAQYSYTPVLRPSGSATLSILSNSNQGQEKSHIEKQLGSIKCQN